jgi:hypothetical protein
MTLPIFSIFWGKSIRVTSNKTPGHAHEVAQIMIIHQEMGRFAELPVQGVAVRTLPWKMNTWRPLLLMEEILHHLGWLKPYK